VQFQVLHGSSSTSCCYSILQERSDAWAEPLLLLYSQADYPLDPYRRRGGKECLSSSFSVTSPMGMVRVQPKENARSPSVPAVVKLYSSNMLAQLFSKQRNL
jgi:hypothetical protein